MSLTKNVLDIPDEVIRAAIMVSRWVEANLADMHNIRIYNVGLRTFLSVDDMLKERAPSERIAELIPAHEPSAVKDSFTTHGRICEEGHEPIKYFGDECPMCVEVRLEAITPEESR